MLLCEKNQIRPYTALKNIGIESNSILSRWRAGATPRSTTIKMIADYFGVTPEELLFGIKKEPSIPTDEELGKNDAMWSAYDGVLESTNGLSLHDTNIILKMLKDGGQGMTYNELLAFASALSKLPPERRQHLLQSADMLRQDKSEP
nr:MAG TPA: Transcriptional regulator, XRE family factor, Xre, HTH, Dimerization.3A [Caudoviricetes sp.]